MTHATETLHPISDTSSALMARILAGNCTVTVLSVRTGTHFTFKVRQPEETTPHFVSVLTGADNENDYTYLGTIFGKDAYKHGKKSPIGADAPSAKAAKFFFDAVLAGQVLPAGVRVFHRGTCARCGRALTTPASVASGYGPECAEHAGVAYTYTGGEIAQHSLEDAAATYTADLARGRALTRAEKDAERVASAQSAGLAWALGTGLI